MKKLLAVLAITTLFGLASCGPTSEPTSTPDAPTSTPSISNPTTPEDGPVLYNFDVKVEFENGDPFEGARVQACTIDGDKCLMPVTTDEKGECTLKMEMAEYEVHVINVPEGYHYDEDGYILGPNNSSVTIVLFQEQVARHW